MCSFLSRACERCAKGWRHGKAVRRTVTQVGCDEIGYWLDDSMHLRGARVDQCRGEECSA